MAKKFFQVSFKSYFQELRKFYNISLQDQPFRRLVLNFLVFHFYHNGGRSIDTKQLRNVPILKGYKRKLEKRNLHFL